MKNKDYPEEREYQQMFSENLILYGDSPEEVIRQLSKTIHRAWLETKKVVMQRTEFHK